MKARRRVEEQAGVGGPSSGGRHPMPPLSGGPGHSAGMSPGSPSCGGPLGVKMSKVQAEGGERCQGQRPLPATVGLARGLRGAPPEDRASQLPSLPTLSLCAPHKPPKLFSVGDRSRLTGTAIHNTQGPESLRVGSEVPTVA